MPITVDYSVTPFLITIPQSDLTLESGTKYQLTVDVFWQLLRDYADSPEGIVSPVIYHRIAATASTPSITEVNQNYYALQFENGNYSVNVINGNTNIREVEVKNNVSVNTNNTTGFINPTFLENSLFSGGVAIDPLNGYDYLGSNYAPDGSVLGTRQAPVKTVNDAELIASQRGFNQFYVVTPLTISTGDSFGGESHQVTGDSPLSVSVNIQAGSNVDNIDWRNIYLFGVVGNGFIARECVVGSITNANGFIYKCTIIGPIVVADNISMEECFIAPTAMNQGFDIDFNGQAKSVIISDWSAGRITAKNMVAGSFLGVTGAGGIVYVDPTCNGGTLAIGGSVTADETNFGLLDTINNVTVSQQVWDKKLISADIQGTFGGEVATKNDVASDIDLVYIDNVSSVLVAGSTLSGSSANIDVRDGVDWVIQESPTTGITIDLSFTVSDPAQIASDFTIFATYNGGPSAHYLQLWAWNVVSGSWELIRDRFIDNKDPSEKHTEPYSERHINRSTGEVLFRIQHNPLSSYSGSHQLSIDSVSISVHVPLTIARIATEVWANATGALVAAQVNIQNKILRNRTETNPVTGIMTVYDDDNITPLFTCNIWENIAGTNPYAGNAVNRRDKLA